MKKLLLLLFLLLIPIVYALPVMNSSEISPPQAYSIDDLLGYCNATGNSGDLFGYSWKWYVDGTLNYSSAVPEWNLTVGTEDVIFNETATGVSVDRPSISKIDDSHAIVTFAGNSGTNPVVIINFTAYSSEISVLSQFNYTASDVYLADVKVIDQTHAILAYLISGGVGGVKLISWNSTYGNLTNISKLVQLSATTNNYDIDLIDSTHAIVVYEVSDNDGWASIVSWSSTFGNLQELGYIEWNTTYGGEPSVATLDNGSALIAYKASNGDGVLMYLNWSSDFNTISRGSTYNFQSSFDIDDPFIIVQNTTIASVEGYDVFVAYERNVAPNYGGYIQSFYFNSSSMLIEDENEVTPFSPYGNFPSITPINNYTFLVAWDGGGSVTDENAYVDIFQFNNATGAFTTPYSAVRISSKATYLRGIAFNNTYFAIAYTDNVGAGVDVGYAQILDGSLDLFQQGIEINTSSISNSLTASGQYWGLECTAYDWSNMDSWLSSPLNATLVVIRPNITSHEILNFGSNSLYVNVSHDGAELFDIYVNGTYRNTTASMPFNITNLLFYRSVNITIIPAVSEFGTTFNGTNYTFTNSTIWMNASSTILISPPSPDITDDLNCTWTTPDDGRILSNVFYLWFNGSIMNITSQVLGKGNTSDGSQIYCNVTFEDNGFNSTPLQSNIVTINDSTAPSINTFNFTPTSITAGDSIDIWTNTTDSSGIIYGCTLQVNPNPSIGYPSNVSYNLTMSNTDTDTWAIIGQVFNTVGTYNFTVFCYDGSLNLNRTEYPDLLTVISGGGGGTTGGGGGTIIISEQGKFTVKSLSGLAESKDYAIKGVPSCLDLFIKNIAESDQSFTMECESEDNICQYTTIKNDKFSLKPKEEAKSSVCVTIPKGITIGKEQVKENIIIKNQAGIKVTFPSTLILRAGINNQISILVNWGRNFFGRTESVFQWFAWALAGAVSLLITVGLFQWLLKLILWVLGKKGDYGYLKATMFITAVIVHIEIFGRLT